MDIKENDPKTTYTKTLPSDSMVATLRCVTSNARVS